MKYKDKIDAGIVYLGWFILGLYLFLLAGKVYASDNIITIDQAGDYLDLTVNQEGYDNEIVADINGSFQGTNALISFTAGS